MMKEWRLKSECPHLKHALSHDNLDRRCEFADIFLSLGNDNASLPDRIVLTDEVTLKPNGCVHRHNSVDHAVENPRIVIV